MVRLAAMRRFGGIRSGYRREEYQHRWLPAGQMALRRGVSCVMTSGIVSTSFPRFVSWPAFNQADHSSCRQRRHPYRGEVWSTSFVADGGSVTRDHVYFHHEGNRALRVGNWKIVNESLVNRGTNHDKWALYDLSVDRCEMHDLSDAMPEKCQELQARWQELENTYRTVPLT
jgi:arylsulfatase A-like enzyme